MISRLVIDLKPINFVASKFLDDPTTAIEYGENVKRGAETRTKKGFSRK